MLSKRSKNAARLLDCTQLYKFCSSAGLEPRNTGGLTEQLHSQPSLTIAANTWVCLLFSNKYFSIYFIFKTTRDKAYSAVKMNFCPDSVDSPSAFLSQVKRRRRSSRQSSHLQESIRASLSGTWHFFFLKRWVSPALIIPGHVYKDSRNVCFHRDLYKH